MNPSEESSDVQSFEDSDPGSCRVETQGGTVYWISVPDDEGQRWIVREHLRSAETNTMVMQPITSTKEALDLGDKFRGRLGGDVVIGLPFVIEVSGRETRILSEVVIDIEVGNVPEMLFNG